MIKIHKGGAITDPKGFSAAAVRAGFKRKRLDLCIIKSDNEAVCSAKFTKNHLKAAPLLLAIKNLKKTDNILQALVINSGNANAGTGQTGYANALKTAKFTGEKLNLDPKNILVSSTGIIGEQLDMEKMLKGLDHCAEIVSKNGGPGCAEAILTTDTVEKSFNMQLKIGDKMVTFAGITKGSGMIAPNMATTLAFVTTDLNISQNLLDDIFTEAVDKSYNMITVDGHMSTNDTALIMANGLAKNIEICDNDKNYNLIRSALILFMEKMAISIVKDGEGATKFVTIDIESAPGFKEAKTIAFAIANSALVKTALFGNDPNWGRIVSAAGMTNIPFDPDSAVLTVNNLIIYKYGEPVKHSKKELASIMQPKDIIITLKMNMGTETDTLNTSHLPYEYIKINAEYHT